MKEAILSLKGTGSEWEGVVWPEPINLGDRRAFKIFRTQVDDVVQRGGWDPWPPEPPPRAA